MLSILEPITVPGGTAYRDDSDWRRFYVVPSMPRVRRREDGTPVFLLVKYAFGDDDRAADPDLPRGAGYLQFDVVLALDEANATACRQTLQQHVDAEYSRRKADPASAADPLVAAAAPPPVEISDPTWSGGSVRIQTTQADSLVTHRVAEQPAALLTGNNACFNLDLSAAGVDFFQKLLVTDAGTGRVDLAAVQVVYTLKMWARLPDFTVTLTADSERLQKVHETAKTTNADEVCTPSEVETLQQNAFSASQLQASGVIEFHTSAPPGVPPEAVNAVRDYAYQLFDTMVREQFLAPVDDAGEPLPMDNGVPARPDDAAAAWLYPGLDFRGTPVELRGDAGNLGNVLVRSVQLRSGHSVTLFGGSSYAGTPRAVRAGTGNLGGDGMRVGSARVTRPPETRVKVRNVESTSEFDVSIRLAQSQVVEWGIAPGATLEPVFAGLPASQMKKHVVELTLDGFRARPVTVRAFTNYERVAAVVVTLIYSGTGADGRPVEKEASHTFTATENAPFVVDWTQIGTTRSYRYRYATIEAGTNRRSVDSPWVTTTSSELDLSVLEPGRVDLEVSGAALDWPLIRLCTVGMRVPLEDGTAVDHTVQLTPAAPNAAWHASLGKNPSGPIELAYDFVLTDGRSLGPNRDTAEVGQNLVVVPDPNIDVLNVTVVPGGDWSEVAMAVVVLRYQEVDGTVKDDSFRLTSLEQLVEWKVPLRDARRRDFTWEVTITWTTDRPPEIRPPKAASGDQTLAVVVAGRPKLEVTVNPALIDFTAVAAVQVNLTAASGETISCAFSKGAANAPFVWKVPLAPGAAATWSWESIVFTTAGAELRSGVQPGTGNLLLVPRPVMPEATGFTIQVRGNFVDLAATPLVAVELRAGAPGREESHTVEIDASNRTGSWAVTLPPGAPRRFTYAITYFLANGTPVAGESGTSESPLLVIKAHTPA